MDTLCIRKLEQLPWQDSREDEQLSSALNCTHNLISDTKKMKKGLILGTGSEAADHMVDNFELSKQLDTSHDWIVSRTGINQRFLCSNLTDTSAAALGAAAAKKALIKSEVIASQIDCIICSTFTPDGFFPSTACRIQGLIGADSAFAFDISAACSGFLYGLDLAESFIRAGRCNYVLLVGAEVVSRALDWTDRSTSVLFGDAAGAVVVGAAKLDDECGILSSILASKPDTKNILNLPAWGDKRFLTMSGSEVFKSAVTMMSDYGRRAIHKAGLEVDEIDFFIPHQANGRIISAVASAIGIPPEKIVCTIETYANIGSAGIPLALDLALESGRIKTGSRVLFTAVGGGLTVGSAVVRF